MGMNLLTPFSLLLLMLLSGTLVSKPMTSFLSGAHLIVMADAKGKPDMVRLIHSIYDEFNAEAV